MMTRTICCDDYAVWPNGIVATMEEVRKGWYDWLSDDYEVVGYDDDARLRELNDELGCGFEID